MRTRLLCSLGVIVALALIVTAAFAASSGWKEYTFPAAPPDKVVSPGTMTVSFPAEWRVKTTWGPFTSSGNYPTSSVSSGTTAFYGGPRSGAGWWIRVYLEDKDATIPDVREQLLRWVGRPLWGPNTPTPRYVSESYVILPMGTVWRVTLKLVPPKGKTDVKLSYERDYVLDRGVVMTTAGTERHLFDVFTINCEAQFCRTHSSQLAAIMRSITITP